MCIAIYLLPWYKILVDHVDRSDWDQLKLLTRLTHHSPPAPALVLVLGLNSLNRRFSIYVDVWSSLGIHPPLHSPHPHPHLRTVGVVAFGVVVVDVVVVVVVVERGVTGCGEESGRR